MADRSIPIHAVLFLLIAVAGCTQGGDLRKIAIVQGIDDSHDNVEAPDTTETGEVLAVTIHTYRGGCEREGPTSIERLDPLTFRLTPFELEPRDDDILCPAFVGRFRRTVEVVFHQAGQALILVRGRRAQDRELVILKEPVVIRP